MSPLVCFTYYIQMESNNTSESSPTPNVPKKSNNLVWIVVVLLVLALGVGGYYTMSKSKTSVMTESEKMATSNNTQGTMQEESMESTDEAMMEGDVMMENTSITLTSNGFTPKEITVKAGTEVTWTNESGRTATVNSSVHPTHLDYPPLNLGQFKNGETLSLVFDEPGTYFYHDHLNAAHTGSVVVE